MRETPFPHSENWPGFLSSWDERRVLLLSTRFVLEKVEKDNECVSNFKDYLCHLATIHYSGSLPSTYNVCTSIVGIQEFLNLVEFSMDILCYFH